MRISRLLILFFATIGCRDANVQPTSIKVSTPEGEVTAHEFSVDPSPQTVTLVLGTKLDELQALSGRGPGFVATYFPEVTTPELKDYDRAFRAWQLSEEKAFSSEQVIEIIGGVLGNKCVDDLNMEWVVVDDQYGKDFAVRSKSVESMGFPFSTVLKRVEDREFDFISAVYYTLKQSAGSGDAKPRDVSASQ